MTPHDSHQEPNRQSCNGQKSEAEELREERERLRQLEERLKVREQELADMEATYPYLLEFTYTKLREMYGTESLELPDDLAALIEKEGGEPLEAFLGELKQFAGSPPAAVTAPTANGAALQTAIDVQTVFELSLSAKIQLAQDLLDNIAAAPEVTPIPDWHLEELERRRAHFQANPNSGMSWEEAKRRIRSPYGR